MDWIGLAQDRGMWRAIVNAEVNLRGFIKFGEFLDCLTNWEVLKKGSAARG